MRGWRATWLVLLLWVAVISTALGEEPSEASPSTVPDVPTTADELGATGWQPRPPCQPALGEVVEAERGQWAIRCDGHNLWRTQPPEDCLVCRPKIARESIWIVRGTDLLRHEFEDASTQERHRFPGVITRLDVDDDRIRVTAGGDGREETWELPASGALMLPLPLDDLPFESLRADALRVVAGLLSLEQITLEELDATLERAEPSTLAQLESALMVGHYQDPTNPWFLHLVARTGMARGPNDALGHVEEALAGLRATPPSVAHELVAIAPQWVGVDDALAVELLQRGVEAYLARGYRPESAVSRSLWARLAGPPLSDPTRRQLSLRHDLHQALFPRLPFSQQAAARIVARRVLEEGEGGVEHLGFEHGEALPDVGYRGFDIPGRDAPLWLLAFLPAAFLAWWLAWFARASRPSGAATLLERRKARPSRLNGRAWPVAERMGMALLGLLVFLVSWTSLRTLHGLETLSAAPEEVFSGFVEHPVSAQWWAAAPDTSAVEAMRKAAAGPSTPRVCHAFPCPPPETAPAYPGLDTEKEAWRDLARAQHAVTLPTLATLPLLSLSWNAAPLRALSALIFFGILFFSLYLLTLGMGRRSTHPERPSPSFIWLPGSAPGWGALGPFITLVFLACVTLVVLQGDLNAHSVELLPAHDPLLGEALDAEGGFPWWMAGVAAVVLVGVEIWAVGRGRRVKGTGERSPEDGGETAV